MTLGPLSHLGTWFFILGFPAFWLELYVIKTPHGLTSPMIWLFLAGIAACVLMPSLRQCSFQSIRAKDFWSSLSGVDRFLVAWMVLGCLALATVVVAQGLQPVHLTQEFDSLQYHYALPRQHLITHSFSHIPWAADDLFVLPIDYALAPFWFSTSLPNKIPQLILLVCLILVLVRLTMSMAKEGQGWAVLLMVAAVLGSHGLGVQMGTAMLDLVLAYLCFAMIDSLRTGQWGLAAVEGTFFFWSKPAMPVVLLLVGSVLLVGALMVSKLGWRAILVLSLKNIKRAGVLMGIISVIVAGPFVLKSLYYSGTPLYPFFPGLCGHGHIFTNPSSWESLIKASDFWMGLAQQGYGYGRDLFALMVHPWFLAVPNQGVNNVFDYPMGLPVLLLIPVFLAGFAARLRNRQVCFWSLGVIVMWMCWWLTCRQARFLYVPLLMMYVITAARYAHRSRWLLACLLVALSAQVFSLSRAYQHDWGKSPIEVVRIQDQELILASQAFIDKGLKGFLEWPQHDVAYAQVPIHVIKEKLPHTIKF